MNYTRKQKKATLKPFTNVKIIGFFSLLLIAVAIPTTIGLLHQSTQDRSNATAATTLTFSQSSIQANIGDPINLDVMVDPGTNLVSFMDLVISYDSSVVTPGTTSFTPNTTAFPQVLDGPINNCTGTQCTIEIQLSIGSNPTNAIITKTKVGTINFTATANGNTPLTFNNLTSVLSLGTSDAPNENVLSSSTPASITVGTGGGNTPIPTNGATLTPAPTQGGGNSPTPKVSKTPTPTGNGGGTCNSKDEDRREKKETMREQNESLREKKQLMKEQQTNTKTLSPSPTPPTNGRAHGACMGTFDPNNSNAAANCDTTKTKNTSWWNNVTGFFQNVFGGTSTNQ